MIKTVIKSNDGMVIVFDEQGEQISEYQGRYEDVRDRLIKEAPPGARFVLFPDDGTELKIVPREEW